MAILEDFGVRPDLTGGHSFGELTALRAAGRIDDRSLARAGAAARRAHGRLCGPDGAGRDARGLRPARGGPRACSASMPSDVVIANKNAPRQCVLSGPAAEIERSRQVLERPADRDPRGPGLGGVPQPVGRRRRAEPFGRPSTRSTSCGSTIPVFANATAEPYPDEPDAARALLASQLARPVEFVAQIEAMYRMGARTFLEVGPDAKLTGSGPRHPRGQRSSRLAVDASRGTSGNLSIWPARSHPWPRLGMLSISLGGTKGITGPATAETKAGLTVKICGANARPKDRPDDAPRSRPRPAMFRRPSPGLRRQPRFRREYRIAGDDPLTDFSAIPGRDPASRSTGPCIPPKE